VSLPFGTGPLGLPLGVQFVGAFDGDTELLGWTRWAEAVLAD
jgi:Asp-tRNA(Asn)/Glu-tRNA(Gln) amidotransferase A subunit family amidase